MTRYRGPIPTVDRLSRVSLRAEVWLPHRDRIVLCQIVGLGVPGSAIIASDGAIGGTNYRLEDHLGPFLLGIHGGWGRAGRLAQKKAKERGYNIKYFDLRVEAMAENWGGL